MQSIRRFYLYTVALISLEIVVWGTIQLARSLLNGWEAGQEASSLAGTISLVLIGIPVFGLHWWLVQRDVARHPEERSEAARALFLYLGLFATLIPVAQNTLALLDHSLYALF